MVVLHGLTAVTARRHMSQDAQGSVIGLVSSSGTVARWQHDGDPWAALLGAWAGGTLPTDTLRLRWQGLFYEADSTKLYYARARWYDPLTKRFLRPDPIGLAGGVHPYLFAGGDPMNARDPSGMLVSDHRGVCSLLAASCGFSTGSSYFESLLGAGEGGGGGGGRSLTAQERKNLGNLCEKRADVCDQVRVYTVYTKNGLMGVVGLVGSLKGRAFTPGLSVLMPRGSEADLALLAHELHHVAQRIDWGGRLYRGAGLNGILVDIFGGDPYWLPESLPTSISFSAYGMEQQGQIVQNCYNTGSPVWCDRSPYRPAGYVRRSP